MSLQDTRKNKIEEWKTLVADDRNRIKLHDVVVHEVKNLILNAEELHKTDNGKRDKHTFKNRIEEYENISSDLHDLLIIISHWGTSVHRSLFTLPFKRYASSISDMHSGNRVWYNLKWYPMHYLFYAVGISAVASENYRCLRKLFDLRVKNPERPNDEETLPFILVKTVYQGLDDSFGEVFSSGRIPLSEHLYESLNNDIDELLYLVDDYEKYTDTFEILLALEYVHQEVEESIGGVWGPLGRFVRQMRIKPNPLSNFIDEANNQKQNWEPIKAGFFDGDFERFKEVSSKFEEWCSNIRF